MTICDALSWYNTETKKRRAGKDAEDSEPVNDAVVKANLVSSALLPRKLFDVSRTPENSLYQLPPMELHSMAPTLATELHQQWDPDRVLFTVGTYGTPLAEAILATTPSCRFIQAEVGAMSCNAAKMDDSGNGIFFVEEWLEQLAVLPIGQLPRVDYTMVHTTQSVLLMLAWHTGVIS